MGLWVGIAVSEIADKARGTKTSALLEDSIQEGSQSHSQKNTHGSDGPRFFEHVLRLAKRSFFKLFSARIFNGFLMLGMMVGKVWS